MVIDDGGAIWLSNPWLVAIVVAFAVGLVLWCHRWLETGAAPTPRKLTARSFRMAQRRSTAVEGAAPASIRGVLRTRPSVSRMPRTAA